MIRHRETSEGKWRTHFMDYESIDDVLEHLDRPDHDNPDRTAMSGAGYESWDLGLGYQGALDAYTGGWSEGAQKAYELADRLVPKPIGKRTTLERSVAGAFPNVGAFLAGAPNAMYRVSKKQAGTRPYVHLYLPIGYLGGVDANTAFDRGCALVAVCDALETAGCRVRVTLMRNTDLIGKTGQDRNRLTVRFEVKDYGDRLDIDQLVFTAAHPAFYRRIIFRLQELSEHRAVRHGGKGSTCKPRDCDIEPDGKAILVVFPTLTPNENGWTPEMFLDQMVKALPSELQTEIEPVKGREA